MSLPLVVLLFLIAFLISFAVFFIIFRPKKKFLSNPYTRSTFKALWDIEKVVLESIDFEEVTQKVVNIILSELGYLDYGYQVIVLTLLDEEKKQLRRIAISRTEAASKFLKASPIPFSDIIIPLSADENILVKAIKERKMFTSSRVSDVLAPAIPDVWVSSFQKELGIKTTLAFPVTAKEKTLGAMIFSLNKEESRISHDEWAILESFVGAVGVALDNALLFKSLNITKDKLAKANQRLKELDRLKDDFVSVASHELRTPMTGIKSFLWLALNRQKASMNSDLERYLNRAYASTERLINLVNDMLNISRIEGGRIALNLKSLDIINFTKEIFEELLPHAKEKGVSLVINQAAVPKVLCDEDKIHEVLINLIGNSLKFTPKGGKVWLDFKSEGDFVVVEVNDNGRGIASSDIEKLFTKFGRLANSYTKVAESTGTGLGLFICKSLIEIHKGNIYAQSPGLDRGSKFTFSLPALGSPTAKALEESAPKETAETKELEKTKVNL